MYSDLYLNSRSCGLFYYKSWIDDLLIIARTERSSFAISWYRHRATDVSRQLAIIHRTILLTGRKRPSINGPASEHTFVYILVLTWDQSEGTGLSPQGRRPSAILGFARRMLPRPLTATRILLRQRHWHSGTSSRLKAAHLWPSKHRQIKGWIHV